jgi:hypothetical protein
MRNIAFKIWNKTSEVDCLPSMQKTSGLNPGTEKRQKQNTTHFWVQRKTNGGGGGECGGEMTQTLYAHMNKRNKKKKKQVETITNQKVHGS